MPEANPSVQRFVAERLTSSPGSMTWLRDFHGPYLSWCAREGLPALGYPRFANELRGWLRVKRTRGRWYALDVRLAS